MENQLRVNKESLFATTTAGEAARIQSVLQFFGVLILILLIVIGAFCTYDTPVTSTKIEPRLYAHLVHIRDPATGLEFNSYKNQLYVVRTAKGDAEIIISAQYIPDGEINVLFPSESSLGFTWYKHRFEEIRRLPHPN